MSRSFFGKSEWWSLAGIAFALFALAVVLLGGSRLADIPQLLLLRPFVVLCGAAMLFARARDWQPVRWPLTMLALFAAVIAIQLVPLPISWWSLSAGRERYSYGLALIGRADGWRPLSLEPDLTWNSLLALTIPATGLIGYGALTPVARRGVPAGLILVALASSVLGIAQLSTGQLSPLYLYSSVDSAFPVGFFANHNHQGVFLALMLPALRVWSLQHPIFLGFRRQTIALVLGLFFLPMVLVTGSRAGLAAYGIGFLAAYAVGPMRINWRRFRYPALVGAMSSILAMAVLTLVVLYAGRATALTRLIEIDRVGEDLRFLNLPMMLVIARQFLPFGSGFGTFDPVFRGFETDAALDATFFNNAHNDLLELVITGGIPALLVLVLFLFWFAQRAWRVFTSRSDDPRTRAARAAAGMIAMVLLASLVDYPLRVPIVAATFAILCALLEDGISVASQPRGQ